MGLLSALIESAPRFEGELLPLGYAEREITWIVNLDPTGKSEPRVHKQSRNWRLQVPAPLADRTRGISPTLLVDTPAYVLGVPDTLLKKADTAKRAEECHRQFLQLLANAQERINSSFGLSVIYSFLRDRDKVAKLRERIQARKSDLIAFQVGSEPWPTDASAVQNYWTSYVEQRLGGEKASCVSCGRERIITRLSPFKVTVLKGTDPVQISSFNEDAFRSSGKTTIVINGDRKAGANAALCQECALIPSQVLQYLLKLDKNDEGKESNSGRHAVVLARDVSRGSIKQPLRNQVAVFWTKRPVQVDTRKGPVSGEAIPRLGIGDFDEALPENEMAAYDSQLRDLLERPLKEGAGQVDLPANRFYLAVLSPNITRLVVREWLDHDIEAMRKNVRRYLDALRILHPAGQYVGCPPLPAMLAALQSPVSSKKRNEERPRLPQVEPDLMRKLIRCMFAGTPPPRTLLTRAVRCYRLPEPAAGGEQLRRQQLRRMALAAAMKLILTYDNPSEQQIMEQRHTESDHQSDYKSRSPYLSGCLLALLEAIQSRHGTKVNTTLVDRFYGAASTAPASVFANLIGTTTKAHLPKLRREGKESFTLRTGERININTRMAETCAAIDDAGGFKRFLTPEEQGQFALGFYSERAELKPPPTSFGVSNETQNSVTGA